MKRWLAVAAVVLAVAVAAQTRYEFESIDVRHAAAFQAEPSNATLDWATAIVGTGPVNVTFGTVDLRSGNGDSVSEGFVKIEGPGGAWRALLNGAYWEWDVNATHPTLIASMYWSAKQVDGHDVVKNFTPPIHSLRLIQHLREGEAVAIEVWTDEGEDAANGLWWESTRGKRWDARMDTFRQVGQPAPEHVDQAGPEDP